MNPSGSNPLLQAGVNPAVKSPQVLVAGAYADNIPQYLREDKRVVVWEIHDGRIDSKRSIPAGVRIVIVMKAISGSMLGRHVADLAKTQQVTFLTGIPPGQCRNMLKEVFSKPVRQGAPPQLVQDPLPASNAGEAPVSSPTASSESSVPEATPPATPVVLQSVDGDELVNLVSDHADFGLEPRTRAIELVYGQLRVEGYDVTERQVQAAFYKALNILEGRAQRQRRIRETNKAWAQRPQPASPPVEPIASSEAVLAEQVAPPPEPIEASAPPPVEPTPTVPPVEPPVAEKAGEEQRRTRRGELQELILELVDFLEPAKDIAIVLATAHERGVPTSEQSASNAYYRLRREVLAGQKVRPIPLARQLRSRAEEMLGIASLLVEAVRVDRGISEELKKAQSALQIATDHADELTEEMGVLREENAGLQAKLDQEHVDHQRKLAEERTLREAAEAKLTAIKSALKA